MRNEPRRPHLDRVVVDGHVPQIGQLGEPAEPVWNFHKLLVGKDGSLTALLKGLGKLPPEEPKSAGAAINSAKARIETALAGRRESRRRH